MTPKRLVVIRAPQTKAKPDQAKRQAEKRADKRDAIIVPHRPRINRRPGINSFEIVLMAPKVFSTKLQMLASRRHVPIRQEVNMRGVQSKLSERFKQERRQDNKEMRMRRINFRRRNLHGRVGVSARRRFLA